MSKRTNARNSTRYNALKELYFDFLIIEIKKEKLRSYRIDYYLLRYIRDCVESIFQTFDLENFKYYLKLHHINYVIIDSFSSVEKEEFMDNQYDLFKKISIIYFLLKEMDRNNRDSLLVDWTMESIHESEQLQFDFFEG